MNREPAKKIRNKLISTHIARIGRAKRILSSYGFSVDISCVLADLVIGLGEYKKGTYDE